MIRSTLLLKMFLVCALFLVYAPSAFASTTSVLRPVADGGDDTNSWKTSTNTACSTADCYLEVDESSGASCTNSDGDTSYIQSDASGTSQTFNIDASSIADGSTITNIAVTACYSQGDTTGGTFQTRICLDGACSDSGASLTGGATYAESTQNHTTSFAKASGSDIEIGVTQTNTKKNYVSQVSAIITYTPLVSDTTAPEAVTDLAASGASDSAINLSWSAPGDDGGMGTATTYDVRYSTSDITAGNWSSATAATGEPVPSIAGTSETMTVSGLSANTLYYFALKTSDEVPNESSLSNVPSLSTTASSGTGVGSTPATSVRFSGWAYPSSTVEVVRKSLLDDVFRNEPEATDVMEDDGAFSKSYIGLLSGDYVFTIWARDVDGRSTGALSFGVDLLYQNELKVEDIFFPPTLEFEESAVLRRDSVHIVGYAGGGNTVQLEVDGEVVEETVATTAGHYEFYTPANDLEVGYHEVRVRQMVQSEDQTTVRTSDFSVPRSFRVATCCIRTDFNADNQVNIADWSIFLFRWNSPDDSIRLSIDLDEDGAITIADFSLFLQSIIQLPII